MESMECTKYCQRCVGFGFVLMSKTLEQIHSVVCLATCKLLPYRGVVHVFLQRRRVALQRRRT